MIPIVDRTAHAPAKFRGHLRELAEPDLAVLHQTGVGRSIWAEDSPAWDRVRAHFVVTPAGAVRRNHDPLVRLRYGSRWWNPRAVTIEIAGNFPTRLDAGGRPIWWNPKRMGQDRIAERPEQVHAARALLAHLRSILPGLRYLGAHRQIEAGKAGCPGPDVWAEIGEFALRELGFELVPDDPRGLAIPDTWRADPVIWESLPGRCPGSCLPGPSPFATGVSPTP